MKETEDDTNREKNTMFLHWKNRHHYSDHTQVKLHIHCNPYENTKGIFHRTRSNNSKI